MPDWDGRIWFFTQQGTVGTLDRETGAVQVTQLPDGEEVTNSVATDETGGMYVVSTHALYRLDATAAGVPEVTWREAYDRGTRLKPGNLSQGSGTTPTLLGDRWVAINDNADPQTNVLVYDRRKGVTDRLHCTAAGPRRRTPAPPTTAWSRPATRSSSRTTTATTARRRRSSGRPRRRVWLA